MKILFVDDMEERQIEFLALAEDSGHKITQARTYTEANYQLHHNIFDLIFLDHDLTLDDIMCTPGGNTKSPTGSDLAQEMTTKTFKANYIMGNIIPLPVVVIHSFNPVGAENMISILRKAGYIVYREPFGPRLNIFLHKMI